MRSVITLLTDFGTAAYLPSKAAIRQVIAARFPQHDFIGEEQPPEEGLTRVLRSLLFGVAPDDVATFVGIALVAAFAALLASWIPARRAAALDPVRALK